MRKQTAVELLKLGTAAVTAAAVARVVWKLLWPDEERKADGSRGGAGSGRSGGIARAAVGDGEDPASGSDPERGVWIYFGSQSGTAEQFANELGEQAASQGVQAQVVDLEDFTPEEFVRHQVVVLVVATYGEGDPTDNAMEFFKWLKDEDLPSDTLQGTKFTVMGLGSRQYVHFNACCKQADDRLERLGATRIYDRCEGDDDQDIEEDFNKWKDGGLWPALRNASGVANEQAGQAANGAQGLETAEEVVSKLNLKLQLFGGTDAPPVDPLVLTGGSDILGKWYFSAYAAPVATCRELRQVADEGAGKTTKHIDIDIRTVPALDWKTADNLEVLPQNKEEPVRWFAKRLGVEEKMDDSISFVRAASVDKAVRKPFPCPCSVRHALEMYCDLAAAPPRAQARKLAAFSIDPEEREAAERLLQDKAAYGWLTNDGRLNLQEFFELLIPSAQIDLGSFLQLCPRQKSRAYTIASSSREDPKTIGLCVSMVQEEAPSLTQLVEGLQSRGHDLPGGRHLLASRNGTADSSRIFRGICSTMLCTQVGAGDKIWVACRPSSFRLPRKVSAPIVMIGAGTGVAPFRGFIREFMVEAGRRQKTTLFFGCTTRDQDYLYAEEFEDALARKPPALRELVTAFSREQAHKVYVQHRLRERSEEIKSLASEGAYFFVCGATAMGKSIRDELAPLVGGTGGLDRMQTEGRYVEELW